MRFSIIIPTRNRPDHLAKAVKSVLMQRAVEFELLLVNDGALPLPDFGDPCIRALTSGEQGAAVARNLGVAEAKGEIVAWLDDDDVWTDSGFLSSCAEAIESGADFVFGDGRLIYTDGSPPRAYARDADASSLEKDNTILVSAMAYRKSLHARLGTFDLSLPYYLDWDWYLRVARLPARFHHIKKPVVDILIHPDNMSGAKNIPARQANLDRLCAKHGLGQLRLKTHQDLIP